MRSTTDFDQITVFGARGHTMVILRAMQEYWRGRVRIRALIDDLDHGFIHPQLNVPVISRADRLAQFADIPVLIIPGSGAVRAMMLNHLSDVGATIATAACPDQPHVDPDVTYGAGSLTVPYVRIGPAVRIGVGAQVLASVIAHDVMIGANATPGAEALISGHVDIGADAHIGPRAVIMNGTARRPLVIGAGAVVGVGAVVMRDVAPGARVMGNPAMPVRDWIRLQRHLTGATKAH